MALTATAKVVNYVPDAGDLDRGMKPGLEVVTTWSSTEGHLDRTDGMAYVFSPKKLRLAQRLAKAIGAGAAFPKPRILRDVNGRSYVTHDLAVIGRQMNADLKRLGY